jgi:hypothetical protein
MSPRKNTSRLNEADVKLSIGDWLFHLGFRVFDEKLNVQRPKWGLFDVRNIQQGKRPDLLVCGNLSAARSLKQNSYIAIEIKCGYKHKDILDGFDSILDYFADYLWGAEYRIDNKPIEVAAFVFATLFSPSGYLFKEEGKFSPKGIVRGPWDAYPMTFTISRLLWRQKDNILKRLHVLSGIPKVEKKLKTKLFSTRRNPEIGVIVSDPKDDRRVLLMLSASPYHWHLEAARK